jgi:2-polyprenyl-3-methyl-5-hydroxy-6-metoxy-1,4-benzoquinol methylase
MPTAEFYDRMEPFYHLVYPDWQASIDRQGDALTKIVRGRWGSNVRSVLDATCGIGTQTLGLAARGFDVSASDISTRSVVRLRAEAAKRGLHVSVSACDIRQLWEHHGRQFDLVISCDNSLPHLKPEPDLSNALREMFCCTHAGGGCLVTIRDYANERLHGQHLKPYGVRQMNGKQFIAFQVWDCHAES